MSDSTQPEPPEWLRGWKPEKAKKGKNAGSGSRWVAGMASPNPAGRPKGIVDRRMQIAQRMFDSADGIIDAMVVQALEGDTSAASLILARVLPSLRAQSERVQFDFDASAPISQQVEQVLQAVSEGALSPDLGKQIIEAAQSLAAIRAAEYLEARIITLEQRQV